jgi:hypothetical protein
LSPSLRSLHPETVVISVVPHTCYLLRLSQCSWFDHTNYIW